MVENQSEKNEEELHEEFKKASSEMGMTAE